MDELTGRQRELLRFISKEIKNGLPPTIREIGDELGIESTHGVACHLAALEKKGCIEVTPRSARAIRLTGKGRIEAGWYE